LIDFASQNQSKWRSKKNIMGLCKKPQSFLWWHQPPNYILKGLSEKYSVACCAKEYFVQHLQNFLSLP
jgi:hypothetical protein